MHVVNWLEKAQQFVKKAVVVISGCLNEQLVVIV
jgi:hypothetical protein